MPRRDVTVQPRILRLAPSVSVGRWLCPNSGTYDSFPVSRLLGDSHLKMRLLAPATQIASTTRPQTGL